MDFTKKNNLQQIYTFVPLSRLEDDDDAAAQVGVTETTSEPRFFNHPTNPNIKFSDLPGIGTPNYPDLETYRKNVKLDKYHTFLIFASTRFTENDINWLKGSRKKRSHFFSFAQKSMKMFDPRTDKRDLSAAKLTCYRKSDVIVWKTWLTRMATP